MPRIKRHLWRMNEGSWGAEVQRPGGIGVGVRYATLRGALLHLVTVRRPEEHAIIVRRDAD